MLQKITEPPSYMISENGTEILQQIALACKSLRRFERTRADAQVDRQKDIINVNISRRRRTYCENGADVKFRDIDLQPPSHHVTSNE